MKGKNTIKLVRQRAGKVADGKGLKQNPQSFCQDKNALQLIEKTFASLRDAVFIIDAKTTQILGCNPAASQIFGYRKEEMLGQTTSFLHVDKEMLEEFRKSLFLASEERGSLDLPEYQMKRRNGEVFFTNHTVMPLEDDQGKRIGWVSIVRDITERKRMEEAFRESEALYRSLFDNMLDGFAYCKMFFDDHAHPTDFVYLRVNNAFERLTGLKNVTGKRVTEVIPGVKESHPELFETYGRVALTGHPERFDIDFTPLGIWLSISVYSPRKDHFVTVFENITERKKMEKELRQSRDKLELRVQERTVKLEESEARLRALASDLINAQETERKRIAHELHDGLAAQLAAVRYRVERRLKDGESLEGPIMLEETIKDLETAITEIRRIMANLRPSILDDLGIIPALSWYSREAGDIYPGTSVEYSTNVQEGDVPENLKIVLFRVVQESISNSVRHGKSSRIQVGIERERNWLRLKVEDNGSGFESVKKSATGGIGLDSMQQRVESSGGIFSISSNPGEGTIVKAEWRID